jgi:hypothetical protein
MQHPIEAVASTKEAQPKDESTARLSSSSIASTAPASAPSESASLPVALLLSRLSSGTWAPAQVAVLIEHVLQAYGLLPSELAATFKPSPNARVEKPTTELDLEGYEALLTAATQAGLLETFELVWAIMKRRLPSTTKPTDVMHLCRMTLLLGAHRYAEVPAAFEEYRRDFQPQLAAYHLLMQSYTGSRTDAGPKCMQVWQQIKQAAESAPSASSDSVASRSALKPVRSTFHYLLRALQVHIPPPETPSSTSISAASYALSQLTPLLVEMEHQFNHEPDWTTYAMVLQVVHRVMEVCMNSTEAATTPTNLKRREEIMKQAWTKFESTWKAVELRKEKLIKEHTAAQQSKAAENAAFTASTPSVTPPQPSLPASLLLLRLSISLVSRRPDSLFSLLLGDALRSGLVPPRKECERVMEVCVEVARREPPRSERKPTAAEASAAPVLAPEQRAHMRLQQQAADVSLQMLRCIRTHQALEQKAAQPTIPAHSRSPLPIPLPLFLAAYTCQARALRFPSCARLFAHLRAEHAQTSAEGVEERKQMATSMVDRMVRETLALEVLEEDDGDGAASAAASSATEQQSPNENAGAAVDLAYSIIKFFAGTSSSPDASSAEIVALLRPIVALLAATTRVSLLRSLLAANRTEEFAQLMEAKPISE